MVGCRQLAEPDDIVFSLENRDISVSEHRNFVVFFRTDETGFLVRPNVVGLWI
jgi:hypothetical protein